jgi:hypothetical protein
MLIRIQYKTGYIDLPLSPAQKKILAKKQTQNKAFGNAEAIELYNAAMEKEYIGTLLPLTL